MAGTSPAMTIRRVNPNKKWSRAPDMIQPLKVISAPTRELSAYIAQALALPLPAAVEEKARHHILDTVAAMVSGSRLGPGRIAIAYVRRLGGTPEASVAG